MNISKLRKERIQKGLFRTNCMDCLDRTNVVQSLIAQKILVHILFEVPMDNRGKAFEYHKL